MAEIIPATEVDKVLKKETLQIGKGKPGPGRPKGLPNKQSAAIKNAIEMAVTSAGDAMGSQYGLSGAHGYFHHLAINDRSVFAGLVGKILPTVHEGTAEDGAIVIKWSAS